MRSSIFAQAQIVLLAAVWLLAHPGVATGESIVIRQSWPGTGDCFRIPAAYVEARAGGYLLKLDGMPELVPYRDALPSPDGAFWRCRRPDGGTRRFFAPPPSS
jgi:hypothetical protein